MGLEGRAAGREEVWHPIDYLLDRAASVGEEPLPLFVKWGDDDDADEDAAAASALAAAEAADAADAAAAREAAAAEAAAEAAGALALTSHEVACPITLTLTLPSP